MTNVRVDVSTADESGYDVVVEPGALRRLGELVRSAAPAHRYALITDTNVAPLWLDTALQALVQAGLTAEPFLIAAGEASKSRATWADVTDQMLNRGFGRDTTVIALGGGVVGDLAGFVAATYLRGVAVVQVPTTVLAMIDAAVGGKTGVDTPAGKNLVGAFHQPRLVLADPETLATLPAQHLSGGMAEAVKHGAIADAAYFDWTVASSAPLRAADADTLTTLVLGSLRIKANFVAIDSREAGPRAALNFGHTLGHALEQASRFTLHHGQAVALGMIAAAALGEALGVTEAGTHLRLEAAAQQLGLAVRWPPGIDPESVLALTHADKKARQGTVRYTLLAAIGRLARPEGGDWTFPILDDVVLPVLRQL